jgi:hypothetical protein
MVVRFGVFVPQEWRLDLVEQFEVMTAVAKAEIPRAGSSA